MSFPPSSRKGRTFSPELFVPWGPTLVRHDACQPFFFSPSFFFPEQNRFPEPASQPSPLRNPSLSSLTGGLSYCSVPEQPLPPDGRFCCPRFLPNSCVRKFAVGRKRSFSRYPAPSDLAPFFSQLRPQRPFRDPLFPTSPPRETQKA